MFKIQLDIKYNDLLFWLIPKNEFYWVLSGLKLVSYRWLWWWKKLDSKIIDFFVLNWIKYKVMSFFNDLWEEYHILIYGKTYNIVTFFVNYYENHICYNSDKDLLLGLKEFWLEHIYSKFVDLKLYSFSHKWWI